MDANLFAELSVKLPPAKPGPYWVSPSKGPINREPPEGDGLFTPSSLQGKVGMGGRNFDCVHT